MKKVTSRNAKSTMGVMSRLGLFFGTLIFGITTGVSGCRRAYASL
ncbi:MAG: hypothetical protein ACKO1U_02570 [Bacteroidota bacterium]